MSLYTAQYIFGFVILQYTFSINSNPLLRYLTVMIFLLNFMTLRYYRFSVQYF